MSAGQTQFAETSSRRDFLVALTRAVAGNRVSMEIFPLIVESAIDYGLDLSALAERCGVDVNTVMDWKDPEKPDKPDTESSLAIARAILNQMLPLKQETS